MEDHDRSGSHEIKSVPELLRSDNGPEFVARICANGWPQPAPRHCISNQVLRGSFLYYSNLLMGEFTATNGRGKSITFALNDIITGMNFSIAIITALIGWAVLEYFRKKL
jgi:hypothetical protein